MGCITELATPAPGYSSVRPNNCAPLPETLKLNGYATAHFGKCHEVPVWETSPAGPFDRWPTGNGFEYFYGFLGGETNQWYPDLVENTANIEAPATPEDGYHLMPDLADRARQCPQWWWPDYRAWFVGTEIDDAWTYVAGDQSLMDEILAAQRWESVGVEPADRW